MKLTLTRKTVSFLCAVILLAMTVGACGDGGGGDAGDTGDAAVDSGVITETEVITE